MRMRLLYPPIEPHEQGMLDVGDGHRIYWEVSGNPAGKPVVFLHGGPGSNTTPLHRRLFDPAAYRIVLVDQRGCGRSTPSVVTSRAGLVANTTWDLVADLEQLRELLGIDRWQVFGGSWGATLAAAYAQTHPQRVHEIILRGVFLLRRKELDWMYRGGAGNLFPEAWAEFAALVPDGEDPLHAYHHLVNDPSPEVAARAAAAWSNWEGAAVSLVPSPSMIATYADPTFAVAFARIALHYFVNDGWLADNQLVRDAGKLGEIPGRIVQGRYDAVCPPATAWELHRAWPGSTLTILPEAGHAVADRGVLDALLSATDEFRP
ncbi:prolyl aminopeptidase [Actinophytocola xinjiangensis]|uniref:Proline iminopeptidase n=2 Tax=Actinophytocola xinjiangensis TaxID=485602 RepID=A0A7Z0WN99_9PSEU|nr:prolyl aminopeptidase [Actinophytocola xinjiangensis]